MKSFINTLNELADLSGKIALNYFRKNQYLNISLKENETIVTQADYEIEVALRSYLKENYPDHDVLGEECNNQLTDAKYLWVIDPIDGTTAFSTGKPTFTTLIALIKENKPILGIINQPFTGERWMGQCDIKKNTTSNITDLSNARFSCTSPDMFQSEWQKNIFSILKKTAYCTSFGGDAYAYGLLASGHLEIILEADLKFYDVAAVIPVIQQTGGMITDWYGKKITTSFDGTCLATANAVLHEKALELIKIRNA